MNDTILQDFNLKTAIVHEWFNRKSFGGAEKVVKSIDNTLMQNGVKSDFIALVDGESKFNDSWLHSRNIKTSFIQKLPFGINFVQYYLPLLPFAIEQIDLGEYEIIISSSHLVAKGILSSPDQLHISYVHTPARYFWDQMHTYLRYSKFNKFGLDILIRWQLYKMRQWDQLSAQRVDCILANSTFTAKRILKYWGRRSKILYPPVSVEKFNFDNIREDYYLCVCRLVPNKRVDVVIKAFNILGLPLLVVGDGEQKKFLESIAESNVNFLGYKSTSDVVHLMESCQAFVYAGVEDFGIAIVEAMAAGAPVIAYNSGGVKDIIKCVRNEPVNATGLLYDSQDEESLIEAIQEFIKPNIKAKLSPEKSHVSARLFSESKFSENFEKILKEEVENRKRL